MEVIVPLCLATDRSDLTLRQITIADAPALLLAIKNNQPELRLYFDDTFRETLSLEKIEDVILRPKNAKKLRLGLRLRGALVGEVTFYPIREYPPCAIEIGYWVDREYRGVDLAPCAVHTAMQYAYEQWDVEYVQAYVHPDNYASKRVLEKLGYTLAKYGDEYHQYLIERPSPRT